ncbi:hypothetical protein KIN20_004501 [Parelaphostrongylus tenuis]|uniref:Uncharacterized protein n=1 Tax=Parelaphostrongylus tenuis TaxID=148309 RepID=A0AAD5M1T5_PARTN|nr:hypothetical protein KIN20_004501 [Parelaphostrongylus tenuis]
MENFFQTSLPSIYRNMRNWRLARVQQQLLKMTSSPLNEHSLAFGYRPAGTLPPSYFGATPFQGYHGDFTRFVN